MNKLLATLAFGASAVVATNTTACVETNTTSCSTTGAAATPADTTYAPASGKAGFTADLTVGLHLPANVTVAKLSALTFPIATDDANGDVIDCKLLSGAAKVACDMTWAFSAFSDSETGKGADKATVTTTAIAAGAARRSLSEHGRELGAHESENVKFSTEFQFASDAGAKKIALLLEDSANSGLAASLQITLGKTYGTLTATSAVTSAVVYVDGSKETIAELKAAEAGKEADTSSNAVAAVMGAMSVAFMALMQF